MSFSMCILRHTQLPPARDTTSPSSLGSLSPRRLSPATPSNSSSTWDPDRPDSKSHVSSRARHNRSFPSRAQSLPALSCPEPVFAHAFPSTRQQPRYQRDQPPHLTSSRQTSVRYQYVTPFITTLVLADIRPDFKVLNVRSCGSRSLKGIFDCILKLEQPYCTHSK